MKYFIKGLLRIMLIILLLPIFIPLFILDIIFWIGGQDPFNTPISPIRKKIIDIIFYS